MDAIFSVGPKKDTPREDYRIDEYGIKTMKQKVIAHRGKCIVVRAHDSFWDQTGKGKMYRSRVMDNPTWKQLFGVADRSIRRTGDYHHVFLEGMAIVGKTVIDGAEVDVIDLIFGS